MAKNDKSDKRAEEEDRKRMAGEEENPNVRSVAAPEGWEDEQTGFPPYWAPRGVGDSFKGIVLYLDERDPKFKRWTLRATVDLECQSGPSEDAEPRTVRAGEFFTISEYAALPMAPYMGIEVWVQVRAWREGVGQGEGMWDWKLKISPESRRIVQARIDQQLADARAKAGLPQAATPTP